MLDVFEYKWNSKIVTGEQSVDKPCLINFLNTEYFLYFLHRALSERLNIVIHCDVDVDGIGTGYILGRFIGSQTSKAPVYIINKDKEHGIKEKHVEYFKENPIDLLIIVDSSSNDVDIIKKFNCDVLVIDHHAISHSEYIGNTVDGHVFAIINNTINNTGDSYTRSKDYISKLNMDVASNLEEYIADDRMSCGLVIYELLRLYSAIFGIGPVLENLRLYQWAGVTLFTDAIILNTPRNQWYIDKTVHSQEVENTLSEIIKSINPYKSLLDKSLISYSIAPIINSAIRSGHSEDVLRCILQNPDRLNSLKTYKLEQDKAISDGLKDIKVKSSYILRDTSNTDINKNYNGVIAGRLCGEHNKNVIVYKINSGIAEGSFRGRLSKVDYRRAIDGLDYATAQGHKAAFGFTCDCTKLDEMMNSLVYVEDTDIEDKALLTAGSLNKISPGKFAVDMEDFKRQGGIWKLGVGNSKLSSDEHILMTVSSSDASLIEQKGRLYLYKILGLVCKAFEPITTPTINLYIEYGRELEVYIK